MGSENGIKEELIRQIAEIRQKLGEIEGKVNNIASDVSELKEDVKGLNAFKWRVYGAVSIIGFLAGIIGAVATVIIYMK